jgi:hypothetical protein
MKTVDVLASEKIRRELRFLMPQLQTLDADSRQKAYIAVAWSFVLGGDIEEALKLVDLLTPEYIQVTMPAQMDLDPTFDKMVEVVANALVEAQVHVPVYTPSADVYVAKTARS